MQAPLASLPSSCMTPLVPGGERLGLSPMMSPAPWTIPLVGGWGILSLGHLPCALWVGEDS